MDLWSDTRATTDRALRPLLRGRGHAGSGARCFRRRSRLSCLSSEAGIYYYSKYERTIYRKLQQKYPDICTPEDVERLFDPDARLIFTGMWS